MESISQMILRDGTKLIPQELANLAWCCAKIGLHDVELLDALAQRSVSIIGEFVTQDIESVSKKVFASCLFIYEVKPVLIKLSRCLLN